MASGWGYTLGESRLGRQHPRLQLPGTAPPDDLSERPLGDAGNPQVRANQRHRSGRPTTSGDERLPGAVPLVCAAGDVTIVNRQLLHGSFVNSSPDPRLSITFGFHRRSSVLGVKGKLQYKADVPLTEPTSTTRSGSFSGQQLIAAAIDARSQHFPGEPRFRYAPFVGLEHAYRYNDDTYERVLRDYNTRDIFI